MKTKRNITRIQNESLSTYMQVWQSCYRPGGAQRGTEGSSKLRFPDFVTTAQDGGRLSALSTGRLYP